MIKRMKWVLASGLFLSVLSTSMGLVNVARGESCGFFCQSIPSLDKVLNSFGKTSRSALPARALRALIWNVEKGENQPFPATFQNLAQNKDLVLLEEIRQAPEVRSPLLGMPGMGWNEAISFIMRDGIGTGVAMGSPVKPSEVTFLRSEGVEPVLFTPKVSLLEEFPLAGRSDTLLVIAIHALNFADDQAFENQILDVVVKIARHQGPVLFAGDFNTTNDNRENMLQIYMKNQNMVQAPWDNDGSHPLLGRRLDNAFTRGLSVSRAHFDREVINVASDHPAMEVDFLVEQN